VARLGGTCRWKWKWEGRPENGMGSRIEIWMEWHHQACCCQRDMRIQARRCRCPPNWPARIQLFRHISRATHRDHTTSPSLEFSQATPECRQTRIPCCKPACIRHQNPPFPSEQYVACFPSSANWPSTASPRTSAGKQDAGTIHICEMFARWRPPGKRSVRYPPSSSVEPDSHRDLEGQKWKSRTNVEDASCAIPGDSRGVQHIWIWREEWRFAELAAL